MFLLLANRPSGIDTNDALTIGISVAAVLIIILIGVVYLCQRRTQPYFPANSTVERFQPNQRGSLRSLIDDWSPSGSGSGKYF